MAPPKPPPPAKPPPPGQPPPQEPHHSARTRAGKAARQARVAQEMRLNLLKRKAQQRAQREKDKPG